MFSFEAWLKTRGYYKLDENNMPVPCGREDDPWACDRTVGYTELKDVVVSTVFLPLDHGSYGDKPRLLFETMVFGGVFIEAQERYTTYEAAETGHRVWVDRVKLSQRWDRRLYRWLTGKPGQP